MFKSNSCWFLHDEELSESEENFEKEDPEITKNKAESDPVFQKAFRKKKPPIGQKMKQKID